VFVPEFVWILLQLVLQLFIVLLLELMLIRLLMLEQFIVLLSRLERPVMNHRSFVRLGVGLAVSMAVAAIGAANVISATPRSPRAYDLAARVPVTLGALDLPARGTLPRATNGMLVSFTKTFSASESGDVAAAIAIGTGSASHYGLSIPKATAVHLTDVVVGQGRDLVFAGSYLDAGEPERLAYFARAPLQAMLSQDVTEHLHNFIATRSGRNVIDLGDFTPMKVCTVGDGSIWAFGQEWPEEVEKAADRVDYSVIRHYNTSGGLLGDYVSRRSVAPMGMPNYHPRVSDGGAAFLECGEDGEVALFAARSPLGSGGFLLAVKQGTASSFSELITRLPGRFVSPTGFAIGNGLFVSFASNTPAAGEPEKRGFTLARWWKADPIGLYELVTTTGRPTWVSVPTDNYGALLGHDGRDLLHTPSMAKHNGEVRVTRIQR